MACITRNCFYIRYEIIKCLILFSNLIAIRCYYNTMPLSNVIYHLNIRLNTIVLCMVEMLTNSQWFIWHDWSYLDFINTLQPACGIKIYITYKTTLKVLYGTIRYIYIYMYKQSPIKTPLHVHWLPLTQTSLSQIAM